VQSGWRPWSDEMTSLDRRTFLRLPAFALVRFLPQRSEFDYVDWSWSRWRELTGETRPKIVTGQTGKAELVDLLEYRGKRLSTPLQWEERRRSIQQVLSVFLGAPPANKPPPTAHVLEEVSFDTYTRRKFIYQTEPGENVPAYLMAPRQVQGKLPAVVCPHQTTQEGKREPAGLAGNPQFQMALHLVKRGYVTFTYDALCFGERHDSASGHYGDAIPFYRRHPGWSLMGKMAWDLSRGIDYLQTLDFVDPARIACIGHSHGGITTLFAAAFDERIRVGVSNCGFDTFRIDGNVWRWSHATALLPRLGFYVSSPHINMDHYRGAPDSEVINTPFDLHEMLALIAPRPLLLSTSDDDFVFPNAGWSARRSLARLEPVYGLYGVTERIKGYFFRGGHALPEEAGSRAYAWLDRWL